MRLYAAIDLHSSNGVLAVIDEHDQLLRRRRLPNELSAVLGELEPFRKKLEGIVVESTYNWYWLVDGLVEHGYVVHLAHTGAVPQYDGLKHGDDDSDAFHLAHLLRLGILPEGYIYPRTERPLRDLLRRRAQLVRQGVQLMQSVQSTFSRHTGHGLSSSDFRALSAERLEQAFPDLTVQYGVVTQLTVWQTLQIQIERIERWISDSVKSRPALGQLRSVPGIGLILGLTILLETGAISRFASVGQYASYCRLVKSERISNRKKKGEGNRKCGNRYLAWAYIEAANFALRYSEPIRRWYDRKCAKRHRVIALKAVAHKIARACYFILRDGQRFDIARAFG